MLWWLSKSLYDEVVMTVLIWCVECQIQEGISTASVTSSWRAMLEDLGDDDDIENDLTDDDV